jgi:ribosomal protein L34E
VVSIRDILKNPAYTGTYSRYGMQRANVHEAIIPADVFRAAQDVMRSRRPSGRVVMSEPFLLSGRAYCAYCGNKMMGVTRRQSWKRKDGRRARGVYRYYQCQSRNNLSLCGYHTWRAPLLESTVMGQLKYALAANAPRTSGGGNGAPGERAGAMREERARNAERRFLGAMKRYAAGSLEVAGLGGYLSDLDSARRSAASVERPADVEATLAGWESIDFETRRAFLAEHVARIVVEDDSVRVEV